jgi:hypothetical protein
MAFLKTGALVVCVGFAISGCTAGVVDSPESAPIVEEESQPTPEPADTSVPEPAPNPTLALSGPLGTELSTSHWSVTVFSADSVPGSDQAQRIADEGTQFVALDISACAIPAILDFDTGDVKLVDTDGRNWTYWNVQIGAVDPNLNKSDTDIPPGECTRGWLTMMIAEDAVPASVTFTDDVSGERLEWVIE